MKLSNIIITSALVLGAIACTKVNEEIPATSQEITITAYTGMTKTAIQSEDGKVFWEPGDKINLFYNKVGGELTSTLTAPAATSQFTGTINAFGFNDAEQNYPLWGVYPYNAANTSDGESVTVTLPSKQTAKAGTFAQNTHITIGKSNTFSMAFYAVTGGIRFSVTRDDITSVTFQGAKGDTLAGKIQVKFDEDGVPVIVKKTSPEKTLTLSAPKGQTLEPGKYYYISAIPTTLAGGFEMTFNTADKTAKLTSDKAVTIKRDTFGTIENADANLTFVERTWADPTVVDVATSDFTFEINPLTGKPVLAVVKNVASSRGPLLIYEDLAGEPVTVTPAGNENNQYASLGISQTGMGFAYVQNYTTKFGEVYSSADLKTWTQGDVKVDRANTYYGATIGTIGNEAYMMTSNNASTAGGIQKRSINITKFDGSAWSTGNVLANRPNKDEAAAYSMFPVIRNHNGAMYTFVTNYQQGFSIYKYDGSAWTEVITVNATSGDYAAYGYDVYEAQDMAFAPDGDIWIALGAKPSKGIVVIKINVEENTIAQIGDTFPLTNSTALRSARIGITPDYNVYLAFRDDNQCLNVSALDDDTWEWKTPEKITNSAASNIAVRVNASGKTYIGCTVDNHIEVFTTIK